MTRRRIRKLKIVGLWLLGIAVMTGISYILNQVFIYFTPQYIILSLLGIPVVWVGMYLWDIFDNDDIALIVFLYVTSVGAICPILGIIGWGFFEILYKLTVVSFFTRIPQ